MTEEKGRKRLYDVSEERKVATRRSDPLEEAIEAEDRELAREAKRKRLQEVILEREAKIKELKEHMRKEGGKPPEGAPLTPGSVVASLISGGVDSKTANEWLKSLDPQALGSLIALQSNNPALAMMAFIMGQQRGSQGITMQDVVELNKTMQNRGFHPQITLDVAKLVEVATSAKSSGSEMSAKEIVDSTITAIQTGMEIAARPTGEKEETWFEKLVSTPEGINTAKQIGLFGGNIEALKLMKEMKEGDRKFMREMKESDRRFQMQLKKMEGDTKLRFAELQEGHRRTQLIGGALKRVGSAIARAVSEVEEEEETEEAKPARKEGKIKSYACSECGATISIPPDTKVGSYVECIKCGERYEVVKD